MLERPRNPAGATQQDFSCLRKTFPGFCAAVRAMRRSESRESTRVDISCDRRASWSGADEAVVESADNQTTKSLQDRRKKQPAYVGCLSLLKTGSQSFSVNDKSGRCIQTV